MDEKSARDSARTTLSPQRSADASSSKPDAFPRPAPGGQKVSPAASFVRVDLGRSESGDLGAGFERIGSDCGSLSGSEDLGYILAPIPWWRNPRRWLSIFIVLVALALIVTIAVFLAPYLMRHFVIPVLDTLNNTLPKPALAGVILAVLTFAPVPLLPSAPALWLSGIAFGWYGLILAIVGTALGMTLPYAIGHLLIHHRVQRWLSTNAKYGAIIKVANQTGFWRQFRVVCLFRVAQLPPYPWFNYLVTVTTISFWPYFWGSIVGEAPHLVVAVYSGILLQKLADYQKGKHKISTVQVVVDAVAISCMIVLILIIAFRTQRTLRAMEVEGSGDNGHERDLAGSSEGPESVQGLELVLSQHQQGSMKAPKLIDLELLGSQRWTSARSNGFGDNGATRMRSKRSM